MRAPFTPFTAASVPLAVMPLAVFIAVVLGAPSAVVAQSCTNPAPPDCILFGRDTSLLNPFEAQSSAVRHREYSMHRQRGAELSKRQ